MTQITPVPKKSQRLLIPADAWIAMVLLAAFIVLPMVTYPIFLMKFLCFALFAASFNLLFGYAGLMSFGHAAFFGTSSYVTGHALKFWAPDIVTALASGIAVSAVLGLVIGYLSVRRTGIQFAMITLALAQLVYFVLLQAPFTGGEDGMQRVPRSTLLGLFDLGSDLNLYYVVLAFISFGLFVIWRLIHSPFGRISVAIRENPERAISLGYSIDRYKITVFVIAAALAGLAGGLKVIVFQFASLSDVTIQASTDPIIMSLVGGLGSFWGPMIGAGIVIALNSYLAAINVPITVVIGVIFMVCVVAFRRGLVGEISAFVNDRKRKQ